MLRPMFVTGSLAHGGAERHSITVMNGLAGRGHECHAVYIKDDPRQNQLERIHQHKGTTVRCMNAEGFFDPRAIDRFAVHLSRIRPSVIVTANGHALMNASLARNRSRLQIPVVATFHTTQLFGVKEQVKMLINRPFFWAADRTVFVCEMQRKYWQRRGLCSRKNVVIYNGVDTEHFRDMTGSDERLALRKTLGFSESDYVVGISAVLRTEKNHLQLVDAIAVLRSKGIPARLLMIGDGPMRDAIEARSRECKVDADIRITGFQQEVRPYIAICDVMVLCSLSETFSLAALEAMAMGKPVVHSDVGGAKEMISFGNNGFLFPVGNTEVLSTCLATLVNRRIAERMGACARVVVEDRFSEKAMVDRYENLLLEVCSGRAGADKKLSRLAA